MCAVAPGGVVGCAGCLKEILSALLTTPSENSAFTVTTKHKLNPFTTHTNNASGSRGTPWESTSVEGSLHVELVFLSHTHNAI